jgi:Family of unknown function (DUF6496)
MATRKKPSTKSTDSASENPCWKGYKQVGMKEKNGKQVPNCVPDKKSAPKKLSPHDKKVAQVMHKFKEGELHSGKSDIVVTNPKQAIAIALSEAEDLDDSKK